MRRTWQHAVVLALFVLGRPSLALAFHTGVTFDRAPGRGGGGGLFYTGSPRERGWDCTACHRDPPGDLRIGLSSEPAELISDRVYRPGVAYTLSIVMLNPRSQLGLASTRSNFNGIAVTILDQESAAAGRISGYDPTRYYTRGDAILASDSATVNETEWSFVWTAPDPGTGPISMYLGVVDGNGAGVDGQETLTDPWNDDVVVGSFTFTDATAAEARQVGASTPGIGPPRESSGERMALIAPTWPWLACSAASASASVSASASASASATGAASASASASVSASASATGAASASATGAASASATGAASAFASVRDVPGP